MFIKKSLHFIIMFCIEISNYTLFFLTLFLYTGDISIKRYIFVNICINITL